MKRLSCLTLVGLLCSLLTTQAAGFLVPSNPAPQVTLGWDASPDGRVTNYSVYFGVSSRGYTNKVAVGNVTQATVNLPARGVGTNAVTYFFAVTASGDTSGIESDFSNEISWAPITRLNPPNQKSPVVITAQAQSPDSPAWVDVFNALDYPDNTNKLFRLRIVAQASQPPLSLMSPQDRALNAVRAEIERPTTP